MQFRLFSFALIVLNCVDYSHCQTQQSHRWRRNKRVVKERLALMNGPIKLTVMELIEVCFQRNTVAIIHGKVEERKGLAPSLSSPASP
ncbi:R-spondin-2 [Anabarilius grahami]|uniref:R-spondin-2 n=1 Tax=Anabarilius grahami TaxID=495550 RepID=A0A3N0XTG5_ANAGA|nr:R-spondin-2 [Anabarilius grahami]